MRNGTGTYILPAAYNPVVTNTVISSVAQNATLSDIAAEMTNSLPRDGQAGMNSTLKIVDGAMITPALAFSSETGTGLYRVSAGHMGITIQGTESLDLTSAGITIPGTLGVTGASTLHALSATTGSFSSTLGVTGATTLAGLSATTATLTGQLNAVNAIFTSTITGVDYLVSSSIQINNNLPIYWKDGGGTVRRMLLEASSNFHVGDVDNGITSGQTFFWANTQQNWMINGTQQMWLTSSGNLGIGATASGTYRLEVAGGISASSTTSPTRIVLQNTFSNAANRNWALLSSQNTYGDFVIRTSTAQNGDPVAAGTDRFSINASGQLLVGTTTVGIAGNAATILSLANGTGNVYQSLKGTGGQEMQIAVTAGGSYAGSYSNDPFNLITNATVRLVVGAAGNVTLNSPTSGTQLSATSSIAAAQFNLTNTNPANVSSIYQANNDVGAAAAFSLDGSAATAYGARAAGGAYIYANATAFTIMVDNASGVLKFTTGGNAEKMRLLASGGLVLGGTTEQTTTGGTNTVLSISAPSVPLLDLNVVNTRTGSLLATASEVRLSAVTNVPINFYTNNIFAGSISPAGVWADKNGYEFGFKGLPGASVTTGAFAASDKGKCVYASGGVTVPNSTMSAGDVVVIINEAATPITITASITTLRQAGTANTGNRTLAGYGIATVVFNSGTLAFISGTGLS